MLCPIQKVIDRTKNWNQAEGRNVKITFVSLQKTKFMTVVLKRSSDKASIAKLLDALPKTSKFNAYRYCGVLKLHSSPLAIQKAMRDEWD